MSSCGICDNNCISILTTRIFDNVRIVLDRTPLEITASSLPAAITPLYASGTGTLSPDSDVTVTPRTSACYADVVGTISLRGTLTYIFEGTRQTAPITLALPISARMNTPEDSVWPFDITVHYSFFADNLSETDTNRFSCLCDGAVMIYVTACMPLNVSGATLIRHNPIAERVITNDNTFITSAFYPFEQK